MGYYTSLRAKMTVKPEYRKAIKYLHDSQKNPDGTWSYDWGWKKVVLRYPHFPVLREWSVVGRCDFIPFGGLCSVPEGFSRTGESFSEFNPETGVWEFACSLKNYEGEIEKFHELIIRGMIESIDYCESITESWYDQVQEPHPWDKTDVVTRSWRDLLTKYTL